MTPNHLYNAYKRTRRTHVRNAALKKKENDSRESVKRRLETAQQLQELDSMRQVVENIPPEILQAYQQGPVIKSKETER